MVHSIITWLYCLDATHIVLLITAATGLFLYLRERFKDAGFWKWLLGAALICWCVVVLSSTLWARSGSQDTTYFLVPFHSYRDVRNGGNQELLRSNFMNALLFYPAGLFVAALLPRKWPGILRCLAAMTVLALLSAGIEWGQYRFALGQCEIDDVIHNTLGALLGTIPACLPSRNEQPADN